MSGTILVISFDPQKRERDLCSIFGNKEMKAQ